MSIMLGQSGYPQIYSPEISVLGKKVAQQHTSPSHTLTCAAAWKRISSSKRSCFLFLGFAMPQQK